MKQAKTAKASKTKKVTAAPKAARKSKAVVTPDAVAPDADPKPVGDGDQLPAAPVALAIGATVRYIGGSGGLGTIIEGPNAKGRYKVQWASPWPARWFSPSTLQVAG